ncbi:uncharacterized protein LOC135441213 [Drosophila montana]|uniref:uncharacterized protein LOC135441213 n=1 Tax=Drosophila montana TaxID=40370 RepID=UPI00313D5640
MAIFTSIIVRDASGCTTTNFEMQIFVAQLGVPQTVHSNIATNFVGASRQFRELRTRIKDESQLRSNSSKIGCEFAFILPRVLHFGGLWEAGVTSAKHLLLRTVSSLPLTPKELQTTLVAVEAVLNSRPLGALSMDSSDGEALTPGHHWCEAHWAERTPD